jgi:hypothetical protein
MHHRKILTRYLVELLSAHVLFFTVVFLSAGLGRDMRPGLGQTLVLCSPVLPACLMLVAVVRYYRWSDEYHRQQMLENWALTAAITFLWTFTYGLLENVGCPPLNLIWICPAMGVVSGLVFFFRGLLIRRHATI